MKTKLLNSSKKDDYFGWLCDLINIETAHYSYKKLAQALYEKEFTWFIPNDDNRIFDAKVVREQFCDDARLLFVPGYFNEEVSMLEVMIGLAERCYSILEDESCDLSMLDLFWKMLDNAKLIKFNDENFDEIKVDEILDMILNRTYKRDGQGGLFPLKHPRKDQRKVELWYQMSVYLVENYYVKDEIM